MQLLRVLLCYPGVRLSIPKTFEMTFCVLFRTLLVSYSISLLSILLYLYLDHSICTSNPSETDCLLSLYIVSSQSYDIAHRVVPRMWPCATYALVFTLSSNRVIFHTQSNSFAFVVSYPIFQGRDYYCWTHQFP